LWFLDLHDPTITYSILRFVLFRAKPKGSSRFRPEVPLR